jgi:pyruvate/2-oxoglutarate dehydrogenase complex dihydrolipoamide acyltransferase (E2) component
MVENFRMDSPENSALPQNVPADAPEAPPQAPQPPPPPTPSQLLLRGVEAHFMAQRARAVANLTVYMASPAGIGEHPDVVEECIKLISEIDNADSLLETLNRVVGT